ncbi:hypothetical protein BCV70DRAFT_197662 [Testicularia cyperi]|uniref:Uncharacterized protein n=1 Tax=Testicularia cyperi TaxID=1882483 RepID=A0A317Y1L3_9BASI|nr:hypothetical protein BCV70DRAFT_197662 [Testicularia cyperi]
MSTTSREKQYDELPDLSGDFSDDDEIEATKPSFEQLNATLVSRGYLRTPLDVTGMNREAMDSLADALHAMIAQREEDLEFRTALTAQTRTLTSSLERTKRFLCEEQDRSADLERKTEAAKARIAAINTSLEHEQAAHRSTKDALARCRRDLQMIKTSALQYKAANDRSVARVRARIGEVTASAVRSVVPDFRIVASAFEEPASGSRRRS